MQAVRANAETNAPLLRKNEAATRAALIDPVLRALGWDTANVQMVEPEKTIGGDLRVDYLLRDTTGKPHLVIEAKCLDASLDKHGYVSKVLGYALGFKVQTVFITDGLSWHCYSSLHKGNTEAITFSLTDNLLPAALHLVQWLDAAQSGYGITLPAPLAIETSTAPVLTKAIKHPKPQKEAVGLTEFIELTHINTLQLQPGQKPKQLQLPDGSIAPVKTWKDILEKSCEFVLQHNQGISLPYPDKAGKKRFLLAYSKPEVGSSTPSSYMKNPIFIYTHYSAMDCIANALHMLKLTPHTLQKTVPGVRF
ncbi:hypothetical protein ACFPAF_10635 [Hymenobacter endophyticus]|uniref:Type I restriction enzyme R protein N-terminal domain-containing protein n=1 Tax=Hymenobacter endophyticus TaxID=3076335 RepID=A0ABU3THK0_9BACT|nr:hypothetical protein [Hymenobacter endophyticus]MDU0370851.1 hypothetical protein [Hymenobacter endophyticus]